MELRRRTIHRLTGLFVRWGLVEHPYGQEYARARYTVTGRRLSEQMLMSERDTNSRSRTALVVAAIVLASLIATGLLLPF